MCAHGESVLTSAKKPRDVVGGDSFGGGTVLSCMCLFAQMFQILHKRASVLRQTKIVAANFLYPLLIGLKATP